MAAMDKTVWCGVMTIFIFAAFGCAPSATSKPDPSVASSPCQASGEKSG